MSTFVFLLNNSQRLSIMDKYTFGHCENKSIHSHLQLKTDVEDNRYTSVKSTMT